MTNYCKLASASFASILLALALLPTAARAATHVELTTSVAATQARNGILVVVPLSGLTKPGQRLRYTIVAKNTGDRSAESFVPMTKIPAGERFVEGSAGAAAEYSVDGGKTWSRRPMVVVINPGGTSVQRAALPSEYNAIRWIGSPPIAAGARATFVYDIIVE
jgi:uncharacterized repeat protein (TIGR01451 family)